MRHVGYERVRLDSLAQFPGNPRRGDVEQIKRSLARFGQYRTILVRDVAGERQIVAGNHTWRSMRELAAMSADQLEAGYGAAARRWAGETHCRVEVGEFADDAEARRVNGADNRLAELGGYDDDALADLLASYGGDYDGTGWTGEDLIALRAEYEPDGGDIPPLDQLAPRLCPRCGYDVANDPDGLETGPREPYKAAR